MRFSRLVFVFLALATWGIAQDQPAAKSDSPSAATPSTAQKDQVPARAGGPAVDAATVSAAVGALAAKERRS